VIALITQVVLKQMREEIQHVSKSKEVKSSKYLEVVVTSSCTASVLFANNQ
jgi:hypothetical protein